MVQANAGLPNIVDGETVFSVAPDEYIEAVAAMVDEGVSVVGGCCGTNPDYIAKEAALVAGRAAVERDVAPACGITSASHATLLVGRDVATIGERINPTGKRSSRPRFAKAISTMCWAKPFPRRKRAPTRST